MASDLNFTMSSTTEVNLFSTVFLYFGNLHFYVSSHIIANATPISKNEANVANIAKPGS